MNTETNTPNPNNCELVAAALVAYYAACGWRVNAEFVRPRDPRVTVTDVYGADESAPVEIVYFVRTISWGDVRIFVDDGGTPVVHADVKSTDVTPERVYAATAFACENGAAFD